MTYSISKRESNIINILKMFMLAVIVFQHGDQGTVNLASGAVATVSSDAQSFAFTLFYGASSIFMFISGMLLFRKEFRWIDNLKKKFWRLIVPYLVFNTFWIFAFWVMQSLPITQNFFTSSDNIIKNWTLEQWLHAYGIGALRPFVYPLWFLRDLFILNIFAVIIKKIADKAPITFFVILFALYISSYYPPFMPVGTDCLFYFVAGYYYIKNKDKLSILIKVPIGVISIIYIFLFVLVMKTHFTDNYRWQYDQIYSIFQLWFWYRISLKLSDYKAVTDFSAGFSKYFYPIFLTHEYTLSSLKKIFAFIFPDSIIFRYLDFLLTPFIAMIVCYGLCKLMERFIPSVYGIIMGKYSNSAQLVKRTKP